MPGGLMQLNAYGSQNQYLNGNPQMSFFKSVYRRYTNFSMENIRLELDGPNQLSMQTTTTLTAKIDRQGDLVAQIYFVFDIPDIFSGYDPTVPSQFVSESGYQFQWIEALGMNIINQATLIVGGQQISMLYGEWMRIWYELYSVKDKDVIDRMIGNLPDLFAPTYATGRSNAYPTSTLNSALIFDPEIFTASAFLQNPYRKAPSIRGRKIYVPLPFWFTQNSGLALPLIALQYHDVYVTIELKQLSQIYTIKETNYNDPKFGDRVAPSIIKSYQYISNFISLIPPTQFTNGMNLACSDVNATWNLDAHLDVQYIFLDVAERKRFAAVEHEYLIEQVARQDFLGITNPSTLELYLSNPVKTLIWGAVRDDFQSINIYSNYTNWQFPTIPVESVAYMRNTYGEVSYTKTDSGAIITTDYLNDADNAGLLSDKFNYTYFSRDLIQHASLLFNGVQRFEIKDCIYFNYVEAYQNPLSGTLPGLQVYSFSLDPTSDQPSGSCNMSKIKRIQLQIQTLPIQTNSDGSFKYKYNVYVYSINYNMFRVLSGMGSLGWVV